MKNTKRIGGHVYTAKYRGDKKSLAQKEAKFQREFNNRMARVTKEGKEYVAWMGPRDKRRVAAEKKYLRSNPS